MVRSCTRIGTVKAAKLIALLVLGLTACGHSEPKKPIRYIIDSGTSGWVKVTYNQPESPELPVEGGFSVVRISYKDMNIATRNRMNPSFDDSEFYYQSPDGKRVRLSSADNDQRLLWALEKTSDNDVEREAFFVGKQEQFNRISKSGAEMGTGLLENKSPDPRKGIDGVADPGKVDTALPK